MIKVDGLERQDRQAVYDEGTTIPQADVQGFILTLARVGWLLVVALHLYVMVLNLPALFTLLHRTCSDPSGATCFGLQLQTAHLPALTRTGISLDDYAGYALACDLLFTVLTVSVGSLIFKHRSHTRMGLFVSLYLIVLGMGGLSQGHTVVHLPVALQLLTGWFSLLKWPALGFLFYTFPDGRFVPRWSWMLGLLFILQVGFFLAPAPYTIFYWPPWLVLIELLVVYGSALAALAYRYLVVASPQQRHQIKWLLFGFATTLALTTIWNLLPLALPSLSQPASAYHLFGPAIFALIYVPIPVGIGLAVLRYRLWDIDILINRTLVYGALTFCVIAFYILIVLGLGSIIGAQGNFLLALLATGVIAVVFQPLRQRMQMGINRLMYGARDEPYQVLTRLGQQLEVTLTPAAVLPMIVETVAQALKLPFVAIVADSAESAVPVALASDGVSTNPATQMRVPLMYQNERVGDLVLAPRQKGERLSPADQHFLRTLAPQIGVAVHAVQLTAALQKSRERVITAREEERRRLRRDLHDGLGPQLSSQTLILTAARKLLDHDSPAADQLLADAITHAQAAITDIRRLVYDLRPPALDDLGLCAALQEQLYQYRSAGLTLILDAPEPLPPLPAAVEVACFRIVQEALTNVIRHARATTCTVRLSATSHLVVEVQDDGQGIDLTHQGGVGLTSMRERAAELGGTCTFTVLPSGGTCVSARLPLL